MIISHCIKTESGLFNMSTFELSEYQKNILNFIKNKDTNLLIDAKAGSGKTSTLVEINNVLKEQGKRCLVLAFNKEIVKELELKFNSENCMVKTTYSLGFSFIKSYLYKKHGKNYICNTDNDKIPNLCNSYYEKYLYETVSNSKKFNDKKEEHDFHKELISDFSNLCNMARVYNLNIDEIETSNKNKSYFRNKIIKRFCTRIYDVLDDIISLDDCILYVKRIINANYVMFENPTLDDSGTYVYTIDFTDMIDLPIHYKMSIPKTCMEYTDNILIDECVPNYHFVETDKGKISLKDLKRRFGNGEKIQIKTYNNDTNIFEYKSLLDVIDKGIQDVYEITTAVDAIVNNSDSKLPIAQIQGTANHKFLTEGGWKYISDIKITDKMVTTDNITGKLNIATIKSIAYKGAVNVMDITVEDNHNFVVSKYFKDIECGSYIAHNCQDLSNLQQRFVSLMNRQSNRFIFVGDNYQSIYAFSGADTNSMNNIARVFNVEKLPLNTCYRCPKNVVKLASTIVPEIEWDKTRADDGNIYIGDLDTALKHIGPKDVILTRFNKDLVSIYKHSLLDLGIPIKFKQDKLILSIVHDIRDCINKYINFYNKGLNVDRLIYTHMDNFSKNSHCDIKSKTYQDEVNRMLPILVKNKLAEHKDICRSNFNIDYLEKCILEYMNDGEYNFESEDKDDDLAGYTAVVLDLIKQYKEKRSSILVVDFIEYVKDFLSSSQRKFVPEICTIHAMKGNEADNIYIYNYPMLPYKFTNQAPEDFEQEEHLQYVAITRAKKNLYLLLVSNNDKNSKNSECISNIPVDISPIYIN